MAKSGVFLTQKGEKSIDVKNEINELEQLLAATGQTSQSTLLLKKRKEMREVDESLEVMKKDHKKRMDECEERRLQFEIKQAKMREQVMRFERFIHENDAKRQRAEVKARQERKVYEEKLKEILILQEKIALLEKGQKELTEELVKRSCFKAYLERIVEEGEQGYEEISDILNRHTTLQQANADLLLSSSQLEVEVDKIRRTLLSLKQERQNSILVSTSLLQEKQFLLEKTRFSVKQQEEGVYSALESKKDTSREMSQIFQAVKNLLGRCVMTMRVQPLYNVGGGGSGAGAGAGGENSIAGALEGDLEAIGTRIRDLMEIREDFERERDAGPGTGGGGGGGGGAGGSAGGPSTGGGGSVWSGGGEVRAEASTASSNNQPPLPPASHRGGK